MIDNPEEKSDGLITYVPHGIHLLEGGGQTTVNMAKW